MWQKLVTLMSCLHVDAVLFHTGISVSYLLQSSLLMSILRELPITKGSVKVQGKISYTSQQPWVFSASLRQNIVFGNKFDSARYNKIIRACALDKVCIDQPMLNNTVYFLGMLYSDDAIQFIQGKFLFLWWCTSAPYVQDKLGRHPT